MPHTRLSASEDAGAVEAAAAADAGGTGLLAGILQAAARQALRTDDEPAPRGAPSLDLSPVLRVLALLVPKYKC
jgi:hypothetical protein